MDAYNQIYETKTILLRHTNETLKGMKARKEQRKMVLEWIDNAFNLGVKAALNPAYMFAQEEQKRREKGLRLALEDIVLDDEKEENLEK